MLKTDKKQNLTIRLAPDVRGKLEFIANRECRTLSQQITRFILDGIECYWEGEQLFDIATVASPSSRDLSEDKGDIPF